MAIASTQPAAEEKVEFKPPVIRVTRYEKVSAFLVALVFGLILTVIWLSIIWANTTVYREEEATPLELLEIPGGYEDGVPDETLQLDSPEEVTYDPSLAEEQSEESEIEEMLDNVVELSETAAVQAEQQFEFDASSSGKPGSATGTGRRALGNGPGKSGLPREQRWFIRFADRGTLDEYAKQLQFFGIELGALQNNGKLTYLSRLTNKPPASRVVSSGRSEKRLYMTWQGGGRKQSDVALFKRAGKNVDNALLFHFYPARTEQMLAALERKYKNRKTQEIRRTYFVVRSKGAGYEFVVTRQSLLKK